MKILHVDTGKSWRGGQQQVFYLVRELKKAGIPSTLVAPAGSQLALKAARAGVDVRVLGLRGEWDLFSARNISGLIKKEGFDVLHLHSSHAQGIGMAAAFMARFLNVVVTRRVDFVPSNHLLNRWKYGPGVARFVAISKAIERILLDFGVPASRLRLVYSGVDPNRPKPGSGLAFRKEFSLPPEARLVGNIGALEDHKGQRYLLEAAPLVLEKAPDTRFVVVGAGALERGLKERAKALGVGDRFLFTGFRPDVEAALDAFDIFAMPSHMEGLGTAVLDAFAARKPVVAAAGGGLPELVEDGVDGLLVAPKSPEALAGALLRLLADPALAATFAERGRRKLEERFSAAAMAAGNLAVYRELVGG